MEDLKLKHKTASERAFQIYTLYRFVVATFMWLLTSVSTTNVFLGEAHPQLFNTAALLAISSAALFYFLNRKAIFHFSIRVEIQVFIDIALLTALMHASGGINTGIGMLMVVSVIAACLLVERNTSLVFAAIATASVLGEAIYLHLNTTISSDQLTQAGLLGASFFVSSLFALITARRLRQSEIEAEITSGDLAKLEALNEKIIQHMKTGVVVVNQDLRIQFINTSAWELLERPEHIQGQFLKLASNDLYKVVKHWLKTGHAYSSFRHSQTGPKIAIKLSKIDNSDDQILIFIEDTTPINQQAQNLKLASLGRLTGSIAHEIRNPLGALSHAAQLIDESPDLSDSDRKLVQMIQNNSQRVNEIVENVMQLSQRKLSKKENIELLPYLTKLLGELDNPDGIDLHIEPKDTRVPFDQSQLSQVIKNLLENATKHGSQANKKSHIRIVSGIKESTDKIYLDIIDDGPGINVELASQIFEPFFTTSSNGTGLGLYITRELCEANGATIEYLALVTGGSCFRITFYRE